MNYIEGIDRKQTIMFPDVIDDYIQDNNPVKFIDVFVDSLNFIELDFKYSQIKSTGRPPYNPADMLKLYIYGYLNKIRSSRKLEKEAGRNIELVWLLKKLKPDFKTIADFRKDNQIAIVRVCREFTFICKELRLFSNSIVAIDSSKFKACNSKRCNFNDKKLRDKLKAIDERIKQYLNDLEKNDQQEAGEKKISKEKLLRKMEEFKKRKQEYLDLLSKLEKSGETQISLTDKDSRAMINNQSREICYNIQTTVEEKNKLIVDYEVTNEVNDEKQLSNMANRAKELLGVEKIEVLADKGYHFGIEIKKCVDNGIIPYIPEPIIGAYKGTNVPAKGFCKSDFKYEKEKDVYLCPEGFELSYKGNKKNNDKIMRFYKGKSCIDCLSKSKCTREKSRTIYRWEHEGVLEDMKERVKNNPEKMKLRQCLSEHPFGTIKRGFDQGYMLTRGMNKVKVEISLSVLAYNIKRVINIIGIKKLISMIRSVNKGVTTFCFGKNSSCFRKIIDSFFSYPVTTEQVCL
jgi:transposase